MGVAINPASSVPKTIELVIIIPSKSNKFLTKKKVNIVIVINLNFIFSLSFSGLFGCSTGAYIRKIINTNKNIIILVVCDRCIYFANNAIVAKPNKEI